MKCFASDSMSIPIKIKRRMARRLEEINLAAVFARGTTPYEWYCEMVDYERRVADSQINFR